jgi:hypothetical protein
MISSTLKIAAALPMKPIFDVFSRKCGVSEITDAGIAIDSFLLSIIVLSLSAWLTLSALCLKVGDEI